MLKLPTATIKCTCRIVEYADGTVRNHCLAHLENRLYNYLNEKAKLKAKLKEREKAILRSSSGMILGGLELVKTDILQLEGRYNIDNLDKVKLKRYMTIYQNKQVK